MLHIAGYELSFTLRNPRYNASALTASYQAKRIGSKPLSRKEALAVSRFGTGSLSILPPLTLGSGDNGGIDCGVVIEVPEGAGQTAWNLVSSSQWDTDNWGTDDAPPATIPYDGAALVVSDGDLWRGCHQETVWANDPVGSGPDGDDHDRSYVAVGDLPGENHLHRLRPDAISVRLLRPRRVPLDDRAPLSSVPGG